MVTNLSIEKPLAIEAQIQENTSNLHIDPTSNEDKPSKMKQGNKEINIPDRLNHDAVVCVLWNDSILR